MWEPLKPGEHDVFFCDTCGDFHCGNCFAWLHQDDLMKARCTDNGIEGPMPENGYEYP